MLKQIQCAVIFAHIEVSNLEFKNTYLNSLPSHSKHILIYLTEQPVNNVTVLIILEIVNEQVG